MSPLTALLDLVLPRRCVGCGSPLGTLCPLCRPDGAPLRVDPAGAPPTFAAAVYDGAVRSALLAYKERGRRDLARPLAELLAGGVRAALAGRSPPGRAVLIPVPSARSVAAARGGDHVRRLAVRAAARTGTRVAPRALVLTRSVQDSSGLGVQDRAANLATAMSAAPALAHCSAMIIDDIVTTGATVREAARALQAAGWPVLGCAVVAATPRRRGSHLATPLAAPSGTV